GRADPGAPRGAGRLRGKPSDGGTCVVIFIPRSLLPLAALVAEETARYSMTGLLVASEPDNRWRVTVTDGKVLAIARRPSLPHPLDVQAAEQVPEVESLLPSAIVPAGAFAQAMKLVPKLRKGHLNDQPRQAGILLASPEVVLIAGAQVINVAPVEGRFPDAN